MPALLCISANAVPESDEMRRLTGKAAHASADDADDCPHHAVLMDAWEAAGNLAPGFTWDNKNDWARRALAPNRRIDAVLVAEPRAATTVHVVSTTSDPSLLTPFFPVSLSPSCLSLSKPKR